jgi:hypothetical protein
MRIPGFTAEESIYKLGKIYHVSLVNASTPSLADVLPASGIKGSISGCTERCRNNYEDCLSWAVDDFDVCLCRNDYEICRAGCSGKPPILRPCF